MNRWQSHLIKSIWLCYNITKWIFDIGNKMRHMLFKKIRVVLMVHMDCMQVVAMKRLKWEVL